MSRILLKITATLAGLTLLFYLIKRNLKVWELQVLDAQVDVKKTNFIPSARNPDPPKTANTDDLKLIKGIGPALEQQLNELGIHTLAQIAALTPQDIDRLETQMNGFSSRVERDQWIDQAKALTK